MACRTIAKASGPLDSLAKPCCMKPYPTISRSGIGAQRAIEVRFRKAKRSLCPCSNGLRMLFMFNYSFFEITFVSWTTLKEDRVGRDLIVSYYDVIMS